MRRIERIFFILFFLSAIVGVWTAYDRMQAFWKFTVLLFSFALFLIISRQPRIKASELAYLTIVVSNLISLYFLLSNNWNQWPADFKFINDIANDWMMVRPRIKIASLHPNVVGGTLAILFPFIFAEIANTWRKPRNRSFYLAIASLFLPGSTLILTSSRAAWFSLIFSLVVVAASWTFRHNIFTIRSWLITILVVSITIGLLEVQGSRMLEMLASISGLEARINVIRNSYYLANDYMITGGGLAAFPGLYSKYILAIPYLFLGYSHNLYLDLAIEQGFLGLFSYVGLILITLWRMSSNIGNTEKVDRETLLSLATLSGIIVLVIHGLLDDPLYGGKGNILFFLLPAWSAFLMRDYEIKDIAENPKRKQLKKLWVWMIPAILVLGIPIVVRGKQLGAVLYADWNAVRMAQIELHGWPDKERGWRIIEYPDELVHGFTTSLQLDPEQVTAHYRLGLIMMGRKEYRLAIQHLEDAYTSKPEHRGVVKNLGYAYVWDGNLTAAVGLLEEIPEAGEELSIYEWWWGTQGDARLAELSGVAARALQQSN